MELDKLILKFIWKYKRPRIAITSFESKESGGRLDKVDKRLLQSYSHQDSILFFRVRKIEQWNRTKAPEAYSQIRSLHCRGEMSVLRINSTETMGKMKLNLYLTVPPNKFQMY